MAGIPRGGLRRKLRRLRQMSPQEIAGRARGAARVLIEKARFAAGRNPAGHVSVELPPAPEPPFFVDAGDAGALAEWMGRERPAWLERIQRRGDTILRDPTYDPPRWNVDPEIGEPWPQRFYADIDIFAGDCGRGDVRLLWEQNRHRALVELAKAALLTGEERYARRCLELHEHWMRENPYGRGVNWASALEVAMRAMAWSWIWFLLGGRRGLGDERARAFLTGLHEHGVYLERHPSEYFSPNNHIVGEAVGLMFLGSLFPTLPHADRWERLGWAWCEREIQRQFHADGGNNEQASCYHYFSFGLLLQAALLRRLHGKSVSDDYWDMLQRNLDFALQLTRPDGRVPMIGDNDDAIACPMAEGPGWDFRHYLAVGAVLFERGELRSAAGEFSELGLWLFGTDGAATFSRLPHEPPATTSACFAETGYCMMRSSWNDDAHYLCFDFGEIADGHSGDGTPSSSHGHADALAFEASVYGEPILIDPGIHSYNVDPEWVRYFRTSVAHNTLVVDGESQSEFAGRLSWGRVAQTRLERRQQGQGFDFVQASHDGYERGEAPVRHRRALLFLHSFGWIVWDRLQGRGTHTVDLNLPLAPEVEATAVGRGLYAARGSAGLQIEPAGPGLCGPEIVTGQETGERRGWVAEGYGRRRPAPHARFRFTVSAPASLWQVARPARSPLPPLSLEPGSGDGVELLGLRTDDLQGRLVVATRDGAWVDGGVETDGAAVWLAAAPGAEQACGIVIDGSYVRWNGAELWHATGSSRSGGFEAPRATVDRPA